MAFEALPGIWTPIMPASELAAKPVGFTLAGERLALFRSGTGVAGVRDRCPHRGVSLSNGKAEGGRLACPFHGWQFDAQGACRHVPFNPGVPLGPLGTQAVPVREEVGMIWVYTGYGSTDTAPILPEAAALPGVRFAWVYEDWDAHWTRVMENMLDTPHLPFVHRGTIGADMARRMRPETRMNQTLTETQHGVETQFRLDEDPSPGRLQWVRPNGMVLFILEKPGWTMRMHVWCVPLERDRTRLLVAAAYQFGVLTPLAVLTSFTNRKIIFEDRAVVESSDPKEIPPPGGEANVPTDKMTLRFRTWYHREIAPDLARADAGPEARPRSAVATL